MTKIKSKHLLLINFISLLVIPIFLIIFSGTGVDSMLRNVYGYQSNENMSAVPHRFSNSPVITDEVIRGFVKKGVISALSFERNNLEQQEKNAKKYFSTLGWESFWTSYKPVQDELILNQDVIRLTAVINDLPIILGFRSFGGQKFWRFHLSGNYQAIGEGGTDNLPFTAILELSQTASHENIRGIAIDRMEIR